MKDKKIGKVFTTGKELDVLPKAVSWQIQLGNYEEKQPKVSSVWTSVMAIILVFIACSFQANAQQSESYQLKKNQFRVGIGVGSVNVMDFQYSPNMYQSVFKSLQLEYGKQLKKGIFTTKLNVFSGGLKPKSGSKLKFYVRETDIYGFEKIESKELEVSQMGFNLELGYLHKISKLTTAKTVLYLGANLEETMSYTPAFLSIGTINYGSVNAKARFDYFLGNGKPIIFGLSAPIVSVVTRMPYHNSPNYPGKSGIKSFFTDNNNIETLKHFQNVRFSAKYNWLVRKKVTFDVSYEASWMHYNRPEHLTQMGNQLSLGLNF